MGDFHEKDKIKCLLWCNRHCCLCGKACGTNIELAHIQPKKRKGSEHIDNAIPLCYDCHGEIGKYNKDHPKGNKYRPDELKTRRNQIYEEHTRHLVPPIHHRLTQSYDGRKWSFPKVGFILIHAGQSLPVKVLVGISILLGKASLGGLASKHYCEKKAWNMNPGLAYVGGFNLPEKTAKSKEHVAVTVNITIIDQYERPHRLLPTDYIYRKAEDYWELIP